MIVSTISVNICTICYSYLSVQSIQLKYASNTKLDKSVPHLANKMCMFYLCLAQPMLFESLASLKPERNMQVLTNYGAP